MINFHKSSLLAEQVAILERIFGSFKDAMTAISERKPNIESSDSTEKIVKSFLEGIKEIIQERQALIDLLSHPAGYGVQMAGCIDIRCLESGEFAVCEYFDPNDNQGMGNYNEQIFEKAEDAVDEFLKIRHRLEMGLDYDEKHWREAGLGAQKL